jgi:hypothetical protein
VVPAGEADLAGAAEVAIPAAVAGVIPAVAMQAVVAAVDQLVVVPEREDLAAAVAIQAGAVVTPELAAEAIPAAV